MTEGFKDPIVGEVCEYCRCYVSPSKYYRKGSPAYCPHCKSPVPFASNDGLWRARLNTYANNFSVEAKERLRKEKQEKLEATKEKRFSPKPEIIPHKTWNDQVERFRYALLNQE